MNSAATNRPVVIVYSILAALGVINGGLGLIDSLDKDVVAIISLIIGAITAAAAFWVESQVTPWNQVVTTIKDGHVITGPAGEMPLPPPPPPPATE
jgi:hypothetical protein